MRRIWTALRKFAADVRTGGYAGPSRGPAFPDIGASDSRTRWGSGGRSRRLMMQGSIAAFVIAVSVFAALAPGLPRAAAETTPESTPSSVPREVSSTTVPVPDTPAPTEPAPEPPPVTPTVPPAPVVAPQPPADVVPPTATDCPIPPTGRWVGTWSSTSFNAGGEIDQQTTITGTAISGTVNLTGSVYPGGDVVGTLDCHRITMGFVIGVATFEGTLSADGLSASGVYTAPAIDDTGTWSTHFEPAP